MESAQRAVLLCLAHERTDGRTDSADDRNPGRFRALDVWRFVVADADDDGAGAGGSRCERTRNTLAAGRKQRGSSIHIYTAYAIKIIIIPRPWRVRSA